MPTAADIMVTYDENRVIRQDLSDVIELMAQEDTPYTSNIGRGKAVSTYHEWNIDSLKASNQDNAAIEGADADVEPRDVTTKVGDHTQIMTKTPGVSGTMQSINIVGGKKLLARELMKCGRELKLDREARLVGVKPAVAGNTTTARQMAGIGAWIRTNALRGATGSGPALSGGTEGYPSAAPGDGTQRTFTETLVKTAMQAAYSAGSKPTILMMPPAQKVVASTFPGIAAQRITNSGRSHATIIGAADVYVSDFGDLAFVPNPQMRSRDTWLIDPEYAELMTLRAIHTVELAKTGDHERRQMIWEGTHKVNNEKAHAAIADLL